jgi:hypothetical protein
MVVVQPCDDRLRATGWGIRVGPLRTVDDVRAVEDWLRGGDLEPDLLPAQLVRAHRAALGALRN